MSRFAFFVGAGLLGCSLCACSSGGVCEPAALGAPAREPAFAVVTSGVRYDSTAIALLDEEGALITEAWVDSGTTPPGLSTALHDDVVIPSPAPKEGVLTLVSRLRRDTITQIELRSGSVLGQWPVKPDDTGAARFDANPHDAVLLPDALDTESSPNFSLAEAENTLLVSRFDPSGDPNAPLLAKGNDLVVMNADTGALLERISLDDFGGEVEGDAALARPSQLLSLPRGVVVGMDRLSLDLRKAGKGVVGFLPHGERTLQKRELPGLKNCGEVVAVHDREHEALVVCKGEPFDEKGITLALPKRRRQGAGVVQIDTSSESIDIVGVWRSTEHPELPVPYSGAVSLRSSRVLVGTLSGDEFGGTSGAKLLVLDLENDDGAIAFDSETSDVPAREGAEEEGLAVQPFGSGVRGVKGDRVMIPDATRGVLVFEDRGTEGLSLVGVEDVSPCRGLVARQVATLTN